MSRPTHLDQLVDTGLRHQTVCGKTIEVWALQPSDNDKLLSDWARHFRQHYIGDLELPFMAGGTGKTNAEFLREVLLPDQKEAPGPSLRAGDFGEIIVADYIEYILGFWCPRELRYQDRWNRNESTKGCDVIGFKFAGVSEGPADELFIFEAKAGMTPSTAHRLQDAINDSIKDKLREAMSLNALKRRFFNKGALAEALRITRFQNEADRPFRRINGAAAILDDTVFAATNLMLSDAAKHPNQANLRLIVIRGPSLMSLIHELYKRAADEA